uniref:uncharacterized protein LOC122608939 n=1 Tax=Erigeron canadensis TaxID=72917 RepID=UPI001CB92EBD|nr:uncharacterized protein LOC122608939 [Erigeron canadensis]
MNSYEFIDTVKTEKENAIASYNRFTKITKLVQLIEVFVAVALISWSSTRLPLVFKYTSEYLFAFLCYIKNQHVVFLVGNTIVVICYVLSRNNTTNIDIPSNNLKQVTETLSVREFEVVPKIPEQEVTAEIVIKKAAKQIERFKRTQSEKLKSEITVKRELRRSVTEKRMPVKSVERLTNEEFRIAVEAFIEKQQKFLKEQQQNVVVGEDEC